MHLMPHDTVHRKRPAKADRSYQWGHDQLGLQSSPNVQPGLQREGNDGGQSIPQDHLRRDDGGESQYTQDRPEVPKAAIPVQL